MRGVQITQTGSSEVLDYTELASPEPESGEVVVDVAAAGVNFIDTYHRTGLYPQDLPFTLGMEGAGTVAATGPDTNFHVGDRVAWCSVPGSYAEQVKAPERALARVPGDVDLDLAAAAMLQGLTAHYLVNDTFPLAAGDTCLIHAGAGGVGRLLIQLAKSKGAQVFATVGTAEKADIAKSCGADHVIVYTRDDFAEAVEAEIGPKAVDVVYDGVGKATFEKGLDLLRPRGMMAVFGSASGVPDPISVLRLSQGGSLFLTRPSLFHYIATPEDFTARTDDLFDLIASGTLDVLIGASYPLDQAAAAHDALEGRETTGKVLLIP